jgi:hypothetical protein
MVKAWHAGEGFVGTDEYEPPGADDTIVPENLPGGCMVSEPTETLGVIMPDDPQPQWAANQRSCLAALEFDPVRSNPEHWIMRGNAPQAGYVVLRLRTYRTWDVRVNGKLVWAVPAVRDDGLMDLWVPAGPLTITADWRVTSDVEEGRLISIVSLLLVTVLGALALRRKRSQLK